MDQSLRAIVAEEEARVKRMQGTSVDSMGVKTQLDVMKEEMLEAHEVAQRADLGCQSLKRRLDVFLEEETGQVSQTFAEVSNLLSTTKSLTGKFIAFEGLLMEKVRADMKEQENRILKTAEQSISQMGSDIRRVLMSFREEIVGLRDEVHQTSGKIDGGLSAASKERDVVLQKLEKVNTAAKARVAGVLHTQLSGVSRRNTFNTWRAFARMRQIQRGKRQGRHRAASTSMQTVLKLTDRGFRSTIFRRWMEFAKRKSDTKRHQKVEEQLQLLSSQHQASFPAAAEERIETMDNQLVLLKADVQLLQLDLRCLTPAPKVRKTNSQRHRLSVEVLCEADKLQALPDITTSAADGTVTFDNGNTTLFEYYQKGGFPQQPVKSLGAAAGGGGGGLTSSNNNNNNSHVDATTATATAAGVSGAMVSQPEGVDGSGRLVQLPQQRTVAAAAAEADAAPPSDVLYCLRDWVRIVEHRLKNLETFCGDASTS